MTKTYTVFYSWQSDTKDGSRKIIEDALSNAKEDLKAEFNLQMQQNSD